MQTKSFLPEPTPCEPTAFDLFLEERAKHWGKILKIQWDVLIHFHTFRHSALAEWNLLEKERAAEERG